MNRRPEQVPDRTRRWLRVMNTPAVVLGRHLDLLDWNPMAEASLGDPGTHPPDRLTMLLLIFDGTLTGERTCPDWETYRLPGNPGPVMLVFTAEPGSPAAGRLRLLSALSATP